LNPLKAISIAFLLFLSGCLPANASPKTTDTPAPPSSLTPEPAASMTPAPSPTPPATLPDLATRTAEIPSSSRISLELLRNFTFWVEDFNTPAALKDGAFSNDTIQGRLVEPVAIGDLNGDGQADAAVILAIKSGGTGTFFDLIALLDQDGTPVQSGFSYIGDRQMIKNLEIVGNRVILDYFTQGTGIPLCCPNEHRLRSYLLENGALHLASEQVLDSPAAQATPLPDEILIDQPATGSQLTAPLQLRGRVSQVPPEKRLAYHVTDLNGTLLTQGEVPLEGEPGGPGAFAFEITLDPVSPGLVQVELVDSANGMLRGRSTVVLIAQ
jgi:hypothetical protein